MPEQEFLLSEDLIISEQWLAVESTPLYTFEDLPVDEVPNLLYLKVLEEVLEIVESWNVSPVYYLPPPELSVEFYTEPTPLMSIGLSLPSEAQPQQRTSTVTLLGDILRARGFSTSLEVPYSVGVSHEPVTTIQRWQWGVERWEVIPFSDTFLWWLNGMFLRYAHVHGGKVYLILLPQDTNSRLLCRIVVVNAQNPATVEHISDLWAAFPTNAGEAFGSVAVGHGFIAFCRLGDFILFNLQTYEWETYRAIFLSSQYRRLIRPDIRHFPAIVPEGILLLPVGIFFDLETYYQLPSIDLSTNSDYTVLEAERIILMELPKNRDSNEATTTRAYLWNSPATGFQRINVEADLNLSPYAVWGQGDYWQGKWIAYGTNKSDLDERLPFFYYLSEGKLKVSSVGFTHLPLSAVAQIIRYLPSYAKPYWLELYFQTISNGNYLYTVRLWNRVYRLDLENHRYELASIIPVWDGDEYQYITPEMPVQTLISYDFATGQLYAVARYGYQNYLTIARQEDAVTEPPAPTSINVNFSQRRVTFTPAVWPKPQEFVVTIEYSPANVRYEIFSWRTRQYWEVSYDGGNTWQPMTGAILRANASDNIVVRVNLPQQLLRSTNYRARVRAVSS
jgi:hypothetical protein